MLESKVGQDQVDGFIRQRDGFIRLDDQGTVERIVLRDDRIDIDADDLADLALEIQQRLSKCDRIVQPLRAAPGAEVQDHGAGIDQGMNALIKLNAAVDPRKSTGGHFRKEVGVDIGLLRGLLHYGRDDWSGIC